MDAGDSMHGGSRHERRLSDWRENELIELTREVAHSRISRKQFLERAIALGATVPTVAMILAACGSSESSSGTSASPAALDTTKPDKISFFCWPDESSPDVMKAFEKETGIKVVQTYYNANDMLLAKMKAGGVSYDMLMPSDWVVTIMWRSDIIQPLHMQYIPNYKNQMEFFAKTPYDVDEKGNKYACTYMFGTAGIGVRKDMVSDKLTKWADLWNPSYKQKIVMLDDERATLSVGFFVLGYSPNSTSQTELDAATQKLIDQKPLVIKYDSANPTRNVAQFPITHCWDSNIVQAARDIGIEKIDYVLPEEGYYIWVDNLVIPTTAKSPYGSHLLMDYLCQPTNAAANSDFCGYQTTIAAAGSLLKDPVQKQLRSIQEAELPRGTYLVDVGEFYQNYHEAWAKLKSA